MRTTAYIRFFALLLMLAAACVQAQVRVAVTPFEAADRSLVPYVDHARGVLEDVLIGLGRVEIVERARMDAMVGELSLGQHSGLVDAGEAARFGRMTGARYMVTGSLLKADSEVRDFEGYGVRTRTTITTATVRVRAYDVERGTVVYSSMADGESRSFHTSSGGQGQADPRSAAIQDALNTLSQDDRLRSLFADVSSSDDGGARTVALEIAPVQENCDLEINGDYQGSTPTTVELPEGSSVTIRLTKAGHLPWERTMTVREGLKITPELESL